MRASGPRTLGQRDRMRASGPCSLGQRNRCGPAARAPREPLPDAYQRPAPSGETRPMRASGPRTLVDDISGVMLNITLSVVIPSTSPFLSHLGEEGGWGEGEVLNSF